MKKRQKTRAKLRDKNRTGHQRGEKAEDRKAERREDKEEQRAIPFLCLFFSLLFYFLCAWSTYGPLVVYLPASLGRLRRSKHLPRLSYLGHRTVAGNPAPYI